MSDSNAEGRKKKKKKDKSKKDVIIRYNSGGQKRNMREKIKKNTAMNKIKHRKNAFLRWMLKDVLSSNIFQKLQQHVQRGWGRTGCGHSI